MLARVQTGEAVAPAWKERAPLFRDFPARYRERRRSRWETSSLKTFDTYLRGRLMPRFGNMRPDRLDHARVSAWFDAPAPNGPGPPRSGGRGPSNNAITAPSIIVNTLTRRPVAHHLDRHRAANP